MIIFKILLVILFSAPFIAIAFFLYGKARGFAKTRIRDRRRS